ncbi:MAG: peptide deformylase [Bacteroidales bacterium]|nr:peptide deformylase [Bacteroidales bacterium]
MDNTKMIYPIVAFGHPLLRKKSVDISPDYPELDLIIENMYQSMYVSKGVGLAAPQIGLNIRLFLLDTSPYANIYPEVKIFKKAFINPTIEEDTGNEWVFEEGCLSIPNIHEDVVRKDTVRIAYYDENFNKHIEVFDGIVARIIQHEYDHLEGVLFVDRISNLRKMLLKRRLNDIANGNISPSYKMKFAPKKRK